ncbi:MAG: efflux RND transporter periplasmic adaptor subunit [Chitinispirillaceae bacterium]|nr:efflux RND transporter periplasmic adaptor subunit [Chitinispirillaceae bacterium]
MKKAFSIAVVCISCAVGLAGVAGCQMTKKKAAAAAERIRLEVAVDTAARRTLNQERKLLGTLSAYRETDLAPVSMGSVRVRYLPFKIGDYVEKGTVVAKMDDAQFVQTEAQFASLKSQYERSKALFEASALSKAQFEGIEAQYTGMKRQMVTMEENTVLKAPFSGVITAKSVEEGELFSASMMPGASKGVVRITQLNPLKIDLDVDDQTVRFVKKGMRVELTVDNAADSLPVYGRVDYVNPVADAMSRTFGVRIIVQNPRRTLLPGSFVEAHILISTRAECLSVPRTAVVDEKVFTVRDGVALSKRVEVGLLTEKYAEILSGLSDGDIVVVKGNKALPDSAVVTVVK